MKILYQKYIKKEKKKKKEDCIELNYKNLPSLEGKQSIRLSPYPLRTCPAET